MQMYPQKSYPTRSVEEMEQNWIVRRNGLTPSQDALSHVFRLIGDTLHDVRSDGLIAEPHQFRLDRVYCSAGSRVCPEIDEAVSVLFVESGTWEVSWTTDLQQGQTELAQWDIFSLPEGLNYELQNSGNSDGWILIIREPITHLP